MPYYTFVNPKNPKDIIEKYLSFNDYDNMILVDGKLYTRKLDYPNLINFKGEGWTVKNQNIKVKT